MKKQWKRLAALSSAAVMAAGTLLYFPTDKLQQPRKLLPKTKQPRQLRKQLPQTKQLRELLLQTEQLQQPKKLLPQAKQVQQPRQLQLPQAEQL